jgi:hypothetical protein
MARSVTLEEQWGSQPVSGCFAALAPVLGSMLIEVLERQFAGRAHRLHLIPHYIAPAFAFTFQSSHSARRVVVSGDGSKVDAGKSITLLAWRVYVR